MTPMTLPRAIAALWPERSGHRRLAFVTEERVWEPRGVDGPRWRSRLWRCPGCGATQDARGGSPEERQFRDEHDVECGPRMIFFAENKPPGFYIFHTVYGYKNLYPWIDEQLEKEAEAHA